VLIERGSEVGGGDTRTDVGTVARIMEANELPDGRWVLVTAGVRRTRVHTWLEDAPYPRAEVEDLPDPDPEPGFDELLARCVHVLRRVLATKTELGEPAAPATQSLSDDPVLASYQAVALSGLGPADQQTLLAALTPEARVRGLATLLAEEALYLERRVEILGAGGE
jgi:Lon protease-like protein